MKRIFAISLFGLLLFAVLGQTIAFWCLRATIKKEIKQILYSKIAEKQCTIFHFPKNALPTEGGNDNEFLYKNVWYDIVKTVIQGDSVLIVAIADYAETHLIKNLEQSIETNLYQQKENAKKIALTLRSFFSESLPADASFFIQKIDFQFIIKHIFFYLNLFSLPHLAKNFPPPKHLSFC